MFIIIKIVMMLIVFKVGLFYEFQYNIEFIMIFIFVGVKFLDYRLEWSRIVDVFMGECNFYVLYYLLVGMGLVEKMYFGFDVLVMYRWRYFGYLIQFKVGINDVEGFQFFKMVLRKFEFFWSEIVEFCQIMVFILYIGQFEFEMLFSIMVIGDESGGFFYEGVQMFIMVKNKDVLGIVVVFLGVSLVEFQMIFGYKIKMIYKERVMVMFDLQGVRGNVNEFVWMFYLFLVVYIIEMINCKFCVDEGMFFNIIFIIDFFGFQ